MSYKRQGAPGDLDPDGVRKYTEEQLLRIQRATEEMGQTTQNNYNALVARIEALERSAFGQCKFVYVNSTTCKLIPFNGCKLKIAGNLYDVPGAGITITNSGLSVSTLYYCYAYVSGGTIALEWSTTAYATDTAGTGNIGVVIKNGNNSRTLVGMIYTDGSGLFRDELTVRYVRSWFNEDGVLLFNHNSSTFTTTSTSWVVAAGTELYLLQWFGENVDFDVTSNGTNSGVGNITFLNTMVNSSPSANYSFFYCTAVNYYQNLKASIAGVSTSDSVNIWAAGLLTSAGTATYAGITRTLRTLRR